MSNADQAKILIAMARDLLNQSDSQKDFEAQWRLNQALKTLESKAKPVLMAG